jgi:drug/metabolite transporter (DMT)-like permease
MTHAALAFPALFVVLWSTGFIAAKFGLPYAPPLSFLLYRFALVAALMVDRAGHRPWPRDPRQISCVAVAVARRHLPRRGVRGLAGGMAAGMSAMLVGLQPLRPRSSRASSCSSG